LLVTLNSPTSLSQGVPATWSAKQEAIELIAAVAAPHGYGKPTLAFEQPWVDADEAATYGGEAQATADVVPGVLTQPDGRWLSFVIEDTPAGETEESERTPGISIMWGATLLPEDSRDEFVDRLRAFEDYERPEPFVSD